MLYLDYQSKWTQIIRGVSTAVSFQAFIRGTQVGFIGLKNQVEVRSSKESVHYQLEYAY